MRVHWIWLAHRPGVKQEMMRVLMEHFRDPEDIYYADPGAYEAIPCLSKDAKAGLLDKNLQASEEILTACRREGLQLLTYRDSSYPTALRNISDPPMVLYYKGRLPDFDAYPVIGVVGTRKASAYGLTTAKRMGYQIARCGGILVSGMARGIDALAAQGALTAGGQAVGVLGCGADLVYPASNRALFQDMEQLGCILSEYAPGTPPYKWNFPRRNRIISGLSNGVLVVEAPEVSGALITAQRAMEQGRDVFVVPGNIDQPSCTGSNALLRQGGIAASCGWDVLGEYTALYPDKIRKDTQSCRQLAGGEELLQAEQEASAPKAAQKPGHPRKKGSLKKDLDKKAIDKAAPGPYSDVKEPKLSAEEQAIAALLSGGERHIDEVIAETGFTAGKLLSLLTVMELKGLVRRLPGKQITLAKN